MPTWRSWKEKSSSHSVKVLWGGWNPCRLETTEHCPNSRVSPVIGAWDWENGCSWTDLVRFFILLDLEAERHQL